MYAPPTSSVVVTTSEMEFDSEFRAEEFAAVRLEGQLQRRVAHVEQGFQPVGLAAGWSGRCRVCAG